jgi:beta-lactamase regulating signal transducer with metallopeptidase domain
MLLIALAWKSALICVVAFGGMGALRKRPAAERVALLRVTLSALLVLPVLTFALPAANLPLLPAIEAPAPSEMVTSLPQQQATITLRTRAAPVAEPGLAGLLYLGGAALMLLHLAIGIATLAHWTGRARPIADPHWQAALSRAPGRQRVRLLVSPHATAPLSWGIAPAWILIDPETAGRPEQAESVVAHEMAHIRRFDWLALVGSHLAVALFWFNPLVWVLRRRLTQEAELAADSDAIREIGRADYAQVLLSVAARPPGPRVANGMALARGTLPHRIATLLKDGAHRPASRILPAMLLVFGLGMTAPLAAMKLVPAVSPGVSGVVLRTVSATPAPAVRGGDEVRTRAVLVREPGGRMRRAPAPSAPPPPASAPAPQPPAPEPGMILGKPFKQVVLSKPGKQMILLPDPRQVVEDGRRTTEEGRRQSIESRGETIGHLMEGAAELRAQAMDLEDSADEDGLPAPAREGHRKAAQSLRAQAAQMDSQARALLGAP